MMRIGLAVLTEILPSTGREFRILPPGMFRSAKDSRPENLPGWKLDAEIAQRLIAASASVDDLVIDYEHQTLNTVKNGLPAPAAGWFNRMEWRDGQGLFAVDVKWTDKAKQMIAAREYRYISPVFHFSEVTGEVFKIASLGLTNNAALAGLTDLAALTARQDGSGPRDSLHAIDTFNRNFGELGIFHPDTPRDQLAALTSQAPKPSLPAGLSEHDAAVLRRNFPALYGGQ